MYLTSRSQFIAVAEVDLETVDPDQRVDRVSKSLPSELLVELQPANNIYINYVIKSSSWNW